MATPKKEDMKKDMPKGGQADSSKAGISSKTSSARTKGDTSSVSKKKENKDDDKNTKNR